MEQFVGCNAHKQFSVFVSVNKKGKAGEVVRVPHERQLYREFLARLPAHSMIAVEASGHYSWLVDEMEQLGHCPKLANPLEAKRRMGLTKKTDKLDAKGLAILLRNGTLPEVWIPPSELRDQRELLRMRIFLVHLRTRVKNRIHGTLARYNVAVPGADLFGAEGRLELGKRLPELPLHSREAVEQELSTLDFLEDEIKSAEKRLEAIMKVSAEADLLKTLPCVGAILSMVLMLEIGRVDRFPTAAHLASYAGLVPRVHSSGGSARMGQVCGNVNRTLKWAFVETSNLIVINQRRLAGTHVVRLYQRIRLRPRRTLSPAPTVCSVSGTGVFGNARRKKHLTGVALSDMTLIYPQRTRMCGYLAFCRPRSWLQALRKPLWLLKLSGSRARIGPISTVGNWSGRISPGRGLPS